MYAAFDGPTATTGVSASLALTGSANSRHGVAREIHHPVPCRIHAPVRGRINRGLRQRGSPDHVVVR